MRQWLGYLKTKQELQVKLGKTTSSPNQKTAIQNREKIISALQGRPKEQRRDKELQTQETGLRKTVSELKLEVQRMRQTVTAVHTRQNTSLNSPSRRKSALLQTDLYVGSTAVVETDQLECCHRNTEKSTSTTSSTGDCSGNGEDWWKAPPSKPKSQKCPVPPSPLTVCSAYYLLVTQHHSQLLYKDTELHLGLTSQRSRGFHLYSSLTKASARAAKRCVIVQAEAKGKLVAAGLDEAVASAVTPLKVLK